MSKRARIGFWALITVLIALTRISASAEYFSIDNVNLALALEKFDPNNHQPQPPGYPFFVASARLVNFFFHDARLTFLALSLLVTGLCLLVIVALGERLFTERAGQTAALLLLFNPVFWQSGLDGPLRLNLALFSLLVAYYSWRAWNGEQRCVLLGACALGIGSGFRPDLLLYLFPLWVVSALIGSRSRKWLAGGMGIFSAIVLIWTGALVYAVGGPAQLLVLIRNYLADPSTQFTPLNIADQRWTRQISRLVTWNGLAIIGWVWSVPIAFLQNLPIRLLLRRTQFIFMAIWLVPGLFVEAILHVANPGHTLFSVPALCLVGSASIGAAAGWLSRSDPSQIAEISLVAALLVSVLLFLNYYPLPPATATHGLLQSIDNAIAYATFETSISSVRDMSNLTRETLKELSAMTPTNAHWMIVTSDVYEKNWFTNWRIIRYYAPQADIWVMADQRQPKMALHVRRDKAVGEAVGDVYNIEVPEGSRIIWLVEPEGPVRRELEKLQNFKPGRYLSYTDIPANTAPFQISDFRFVPRRTFPQSHAS